FFFHMFTPQMLLLSAVALLLLLTLSSPVKTGKCPKDCSCDNTKLSVVCVGKMLTEIPSADEITVKLDLRNNNLQILPRGAFLHTPYLTHLNLQRCNVIKVKEGAFRALGRLVFLNLAYNKIDFLYQESFDGLSSLKELHLDHNRIEEIQPGAFSQLGHLNMLALNHNQLVYIPNLVFQGLQSIKLLRMGHNSLNNLAPEAFAGLYTLSRLSLDHNELQFFPTQAMMRLDNYNTMTYLGEEAVTMRKLRHLLLHHTSLQDLSEQAFSKAPFLSHVDLSLNQLRYMEPLSGPKKLDVLNLTGNPIYCNCYLKPLKEWATARGVKLLGACTGPPHLSEELLQEVTSSDLRCHGGSQSMGKKEEEEEQKKEESKGNATAKPNQRVKCPSNCKCEIETHHATCEGQGHTKVPRGFPAKTQLLDLRGNHFHYLPTLSFPGTGKVVSLHLESCGIHEIEGGAFQGMNSLLYLYLSDNNLTLLDPKIFAGIQNLTYLHLEGNQLTQFPGSALSLLPNLFVLHLERNNISKLEPSGLLSSVTPTELSLSNNSTNVMARGALTSASIGCLYLDSNRLTEVPTSALTKTPNLEELSLSQNPILRVGRKAFQPISQSLKRLYMDQMGMEKMSEDALQDLGSALRHLTVRGNQLKELPDLRPLTGLEGVDLRDNPLLCDCALLPLRRSVRVLTRSVRFEVTATCGNPPDLRGQQVRDINVFASCSENASINQDGSREPGLLTITKPGSLKTPKEKTRPAKSKLSKSSKKRSQKKSGTPKKTTNKMAL
uniref:Chondroadherin-like protein n=1 Tax=Oryzias latipes TaxID=8090 RepID=A0A3P9IE34_ORYLA